MVSSVSFIYVFDVSIVMLNDNVLINSISILNDFLWLNCCYCEVVNVCGNPLDFIIKGCSHMLELLSFV